MNEGRVFDCIDRVLFRTVLRPIDAGEIKDLAESVAHFSEEKDKIGILFTFFDAVDTKAAALLTHISLIAAALTFMYGWHISRLLKALISFEIVIYLFISLLCLRCVRFTTRTRSSPVNLLNASVADTMEAEFQKRRAIHNFAATVTIYATLLFISILVLGTVFTND
jgi:hypothetical protein